VEVNDIEAKGNSMLLCLKKINAAYDHMSESLEKMISNLHNGLSREVYTIQPQRHYNDGRCISWSCPKCGGKVIQITKTAAGGTVIDDWFQCEDCKVRIAP
jgi:hypothetical protein